MKIETIKLKGWGELNKEQYRNIWAGEDLNRLKYICESPEEREIDEDFIQFKHTITDRQFEVYLKEQQ